jgi:hypothetical protein
MPDSPVSNTTMMVTHCKLPVTLSSCAPRSDFGAVPISYRRRRSETRRVRCRAKLMTTPQNVTIMVADFRAFGAALPHSSLDTSRSIKDPSSLSPRRFGNKLISRSYLPGILPARLTDGDEIELRHPLTRVEKRKGNTTLAENQLKQV